MKEILKILEQIQDLRSKEIMDGHDHRVDWDVRFEIDKLISIAIDLALWSK